MIFKNWYKLSLLLSSIQKRIFSFEYSHWNVDEWNKNKTLKNNHKKSKSFKKKTGHEI